jgi:hypothetical protein
VNLVKRLRTWLVVALSMAAAISAQGESRTLEGLVDAVVRNGPDSMLPAHLSVVLGLSRGEQKTPVKQAVIHDLHTVRTFNVCTANHDDLVILTYDEQRKSTKAYLLARSGELRRAVDYQAGGAPHERSPADARADFAREFKFWMEFKY